MMDDRFKEAIKILTEKYARLELVERWRVDDARAIDGLLRENASLQQRVETLAPLAPEARRLINILDSAVPNPGWRTRLLVLLSALAATQDNAGEQGEG